MNTEELITKIVGCAYNVHKVLAPGYLESVYKNALMHELNANGLNAADEVAINVLYKNVLVGEFKADIIVDRRVIIELKAVNSLNRQHEAQLVNYLTSTGIDDGLLINFGSEKIQIKRKYRVYRDN